MNAQPPPPAAQLRVIRKRIAELMRELDALRAQEAAIAGKVDRPGPACTVPAERLSIRGGEHHG